MRAQDSNEKFASKTALDKSRGGDSGPLELPAAPGLMTVADCRFADLALSEFGRRIDADHWLGARVVCRVAPCQTEAQTVPASSSAADYTKLYSFLRVCLDASDDGIEKLSTDRLSAGAKRLSLGFTERARLLLHAVPGLLDSNQCGAQNVFLQQTVEVIVIPAGNPLFYFASIGKLKDTMPLRQLLMDRLTAVRGSVTRTLEVRPEL